MAGRDQLRHQPTPDCSGRTSNENTHQKSSPVSFTDAVMLSETGSGSVL
jgi:hypothetical protein